MKMLVAPARTRRDYPVLFTEALLHLCRETHLWLFLLILAGYASYRACQFVPLRHQYKVAYWRLVLIPAGYASYRARQSFPLRHQYKVALSILVWLLSSRFLSCPLPSGCGHPVSCRSRTHGRDRQRTVAITAQRRLRAEQNSYSSYTSVCLVR